MKWRCDSARPLNARNEYRNENDFMSNGTNYERDEDNGRCYALYESTNLRSKFDGMLVKRRISAKVFEERKAECLRAVEKYEQFLVSIGCRVDNN